MDRTINVTVTGEFVRKDSKNAGVQGEANVTGLHIVMSDDWGGVLQAHHLAQRPGRKPRGGAAVQQRGGPGGKEGPADLRHGHSGGAAGPGGLVQLLPLRASGRATPPPLPSR